MILIRLMDKKMPWDKTNDPRILRFAGDAPRPLRAQDWFSRLLRPDPDEAGNAPPFRDAESRQLLAACGAALPDEQNDWYSVCLEGERIELSCLRPEIRFGLAVLDASRRGRYSWYEEAGANIWRALAGMPFDILLCLSRPEAGALGFLLQPAADCRVLNFPYQGREIEVTVGRISPEEELLYKALPADHPVPEDKPLYQTGDGRYRMDRWAFSDWMEYDWRDDPDSVVRHIEESLQKTVLLARPAGRVCYCSADEPGGGEFRHVFCTLKETPPEAESRRPAILLISKHPDGSWPLWQRCAIKYPDFDDLLASIEWCHTPDAKWCHDSDNEWGNTPDAECFGLIVDVNERMCCAEDLDRTILGFHWCGETLEICDPYDGMRQFADALKAAVVSGRCIPNAGDPD